MGKLYTQEYVSNYLITKRNFKILDTYKDIDTPIQFLCTCGRIGKISFYRIKNGAFCRQCGLEKRANSKKHSQEYVNKIFKDGGGECLDIYKDSYTPLKFKCSCGNIDKIYLHNFKKGCRCNSCAIKTTKLKLSGSNHYNWNPNREQVELNKKIHKASKYIIKDCLKLLGLKKNSKTEELLGYTRKDLLEHLQKDPNFENWRNDSFNYHIDHIFPVKAFVENGIEDLNIINNLDNLRIISAKENLSKNDKYIQEDFESYLINKDIIFKSKINEE